MFNKQSKEEKKEEKLKRLIECYHLDIFEDDVDQDIAAEIAKEMASNNNMLLFNACQKLNSWSFFFFFTIPCLSLFIPYAFAHISLLPFTSFFFLFFFFFLLFIFYFFL